MKHAEPMLTSAIVRTPTGESRFVARPRPILSKPSAEPDAAATTKRQHIWSCASVETVGKACRATAPRRLSRRQRGGVIRGGASAAAVAMSPIVGRRMLLFETARAVVEYLSCAAAHNSSVAIRSEETAVPR